MLHDHPEDQILGISIDPIRNSSSLHDICDDLVFLSQIVPKFKEAKSNENWISAEQEVLNQFARNKVLNLVPGPNDHPIIGTKWIYRNKLDEVGRLVIQGFNQEEGIYYANLCTRS